MKNKPDSEGYYEEYHSILDTLYLIKLNRIGRSLSQEELSFLIGRSANYMESKEDLSVGDLTVKDLYWIAAAFYLPPTMIFMGKGIKVGKSNSEAHTVDVAPTLAVQGKIKIPVEIDGRELSLLNK